MKSLFNLIEEKDRYKVLTFATHERSQSNMSDINADFYLYGQPPHVKTWNDKYAKLPSNHFILPDNYIPIGINFDFVLSQSKFVQFELAKRFANSLQIPIITIEHTWPTTNIPIQNIMNMKNMRGDVNIFIGENQSRAWEEEKPYIIRHCVDTNMFSPNKTVKRENHILSVANDYINRDYCLGFSQYRTVTNGLPTFPVGDTPGLSESAKDTEELSRMYADSKIFINTSTESQIPTSLLEAMASGCAVVSSNTCDIPYYIQHGVNGFLANTDEEMRSCLLTLLRDDNIANFLGQNARKTILEKCSKEKFTKDWDNLFKKTTESQLRLNNEG